tara:strand:- start:1448 stop:1666 length:219 start_codon:yes stop_codon:yes gene_type:complete
MSALETIDEVMAIAKRSLEIHGDYNEAIASLNNKVDLEARHLPEDWRYGNTRSMMLNLGARDILVSLRNAGL